MKLTEAQFKSTMGSPMRRLGAEDQPPLDFWPYVEKIPAEDFEGHDCSEGIVTYAWENPDATYQHVLINSQQQGISMVIVLDLKAKKVYGHHLLDLHREAAAKQT